MLDCTAWTSLALSTVFYLFIAHLLNSLTLAERIQRLKISAKLQISNWLLKIKCTISHRRCKWSAECAFLLFIWGYSTEKARCECSATAPSRSKHKHCIRIATTHLCGPRNTSAVRECASSVIHRCTRGLPMAGALMQSSLANTRNVLPRTYTLTYRGQKSGQGQNTWAQFQEQAKQALLLHITDLLPILIFST